MGSHCVAQVDFWPSHERTQASQNLLLITGFLQGVGNFLHFASFSRSFYFFFFSFFFLQYKHMIKITKKGGQASAPAPL